MLLFLVRHSLLFMFAFAVLGFLIPSVSLAFFPFLPFVLFTLMTLTLLGMKQNELIKRLSSKEIWLYAVLHSAVFMVVVGVIGWWLSFEQNLLLAVVAVAATGSLFATPAIVRALGFDSLQAMAMTIATTLVLPISIFLVLVLYQTERVELDWISYFIRLLVFIFGPMLFSFLVHRFLPEESLSRFLIKISPYTILLVFAFPFGLVGSFRVLFDQDPMMALKYFMIATGLCCLFFALSYCLYRKQGKAIALTAAITSGNRNVLLTYSIAGVLLGPAFLPLAGALQIPTYLLPVFTRWLSRILLK
jgi:BASS family bile acid:Na+ symporter